MALAILVRDKQALASVLAATGLGMFVLGVILPLVTAFSVGPKGIEAQLKQFEEKIDRVEEKVDAIVQLSTVKARVEIPPPTITVDNPPPDDNP